MGIPVEAAPAPSWWIPPGRLLAALCVAALIAGIAIGYRSTVPYDPLASAPQGVSAALAGVEQGRTYTAVVPLNTRSGELATLISAAPAGDTGARLLRVTGLVVDPGAYLVHPGGPTGALSALGSGASLRPLAGLRFSPPTAGSLWTHAWVAVTFRMERSGCVDLPRLRLRYAVGSTEFTRVVALSLRVTSGGTEQANSCLNDGAALPASTQMRS